MRSLNPQNCKPWQILIAASASFLIGTGISYLLSLRFISADGFALNSYQTAFLCMLLIASCAAEEFVFRFLLYGMAKKLLLRLKFPLFKRKKLYIAEDKDNDEDKDSRIKSILIQILFVFASMLFSLAHIRNPEVVRSSDKAMILFIYFIAGLYFTYLYEVSDRIYVPLALHFLNNVMSTFAVKSAYSSIAGGTSAFISDLPPDSFLSLACEFVPLALSAACVARFLSVGLSDLNFVRRLGRKRRKEMETHIS
ncbi:MAG TPA: hypothetical protein DCO86_05715 [Spirochaetaceae bacterium]|nr:hypothetical protein [Spirochaetaceae bacterium]